MASKFKLELNTYLGAVHIHTTNSDGSGSVAEVVYAAKQAGLSWIIITDHNNMNVEEGFYNGVCVIAGEEISPPNNNHYLAFGINSAIQPDDEENLQNTLNSVREQGGFGFAAHPDERLSRNNSYSPIRWTDKSVIPDGVEIWNWFSMWGDYLNEKNLFTLASSFLFKNSLVKRPHEETLRWWDELNASSDKIVPAIGGVDAHAMKVRKCFLPLTIFPYKTMLKTITNVISMETPLSGDFRTAKKQILNTLKSGNNIVFNRRVSKGVPSVRVFNKETMVTPGGRIKLDRETFIDIKAPREGIIRIIKDGKEFSSKLRTKYKTLLPEAGKYRVEILFDGYGWAYSNPIEVVL